MSVPNLSHDPLAGRKFHRERIALLILRWRLSDLQFLARSGPCQERFHVHIELLDERDQFIVAQVKVAILEVAEFGLRPLAAQSINELLLGKRSGLTERAQPAADFWVWREFRNFRFFA